MWSTTFHTNLTGKNLKVLNILFFKFQTQLFTLYLQIMKLITDCTVAMITYCALKITSTCSQMIGFSCDLNITTSLD